MSDIVPFQQNDWAGLERVASALAKSSLVPTAYRGKPENILLASIAGMDFGWSPVMAMRSFHVIEGQPSLKPEIMLALVRRAGHSVQGDVTDDHATAIGKRADSGDRMEVTYTLEDARRAGLLSKQNWKNYPRDMMWARAISGLCRRLFADVTLGAAYTADELGAVVNADGDVIDNASPAAIASTAISIEEMVEQNRRRFVEACEREGIDPADVLRDAGEDDVTIENLPKLRDVFKQIKDRLDAHPAELEPVIEPVIEAKVLHINEQALPGAKKKRTTSGQPVAPGHLTDTQRAHLMALSNALGWDRDARLEFSADVLAIELESWNDLSQFQAEQLIAGMQAIKEAHGDGS